MYHNHQRSAEQQFHRTTCPPALVFPLQQQFFSLLRDWTDSQEENACTLSLSKHKHAIHQREAQSNLLA